MSTYDYAPADDIASCPLCGRDTSDIHCTSARCPWALCDHCWVWIDGHGQTASARSERTHRNRTYPGYEDGAE